MKSAFLLSNDGGLDSLVRSLLVAQGAHATPDSVQLSQEGPGRGSFVYYGRVKPEVEWEFRDPPWEAADGVALPDMATVDGYYVECRWEEQVAEVARALAEASPSPLWVMDSNGVVWDAAGVDPARIHL